MVESKGVMVGSMLMVGGAMVGAGLGLLFAPKSGRETREQIEGYAHDAHMQAVAMGDRVKGNLNGVVEKVGAYLPKRKLL